MTARPLGSGHVVEVARPGTAPRPNFNGRGLSLLNLIIGINKQI